jgi:hypothetical protein
MSFKKAGHQLGFLVSGSGDELLKPKEVYIVGQVGGYRFG